MAKDEASTPTDRLRWWEEVPNGKWACRARLVAQGQTDLFFRQCDIVSQPQPLDSPSRP